MKLADIDVASLARELRASAQRTDDERVRRYNNRDISLDLSAGFLAATFLLRGIARALEEQLPQDQPEPGKRAIDLDDD